MSGINCTVTKRCDCSTWIRATLGDRGSLASQQKFGLNSITQQPPPPAWLRFLQQFNQPLVYLLLLAVIVTAVLGEWVDSAVIFGVVFANAIVVSCRRRGDECDRCAFRMITPSLPCGGTEMHYG
jgi:magnesium-transporting ATPase (P-type)